jgi:alpha-1,3-rhamnosyl/mannosyltransferase
VAASDPHQLAPEGSTTLTRLVRIAIDARSAAETDAGRGRFLRGILTGLSRLDGDHEFLLYAREPWPSSVLDDRFVWRTFDAPGLAWPLRAGAQMSASSEVGLASSSYALTAPWRIPGAAIVHDFAPFHRGLKTPRGALLERLTLPIAVRRCQALISISETTQRELVERFPAAAPKSTFAHPAADSLFSPEAGPDDEAILRRHGLRRPFALATGTLEPRKNLVRLIDAFTSLDERERRGWTLALAGASGWHTDTTFASVAAHADLVQTLGFVPDEELACLYRNAEVFCYVSLYEGFGIPVLEAMQSGTAVLTSSISSMPEVGGEAARYADPREVADIRRGLSELLGDEQLRARCAAAGIARAAGFDWTASAAKVLATLEGLAAAAQ